MQVFDWFWDVPGIGGGGEYWTRVKNITPDHLIGYWRLNEKSGSVVTDSSGNGHNGSAVGVTWGQGGIGDGDTAPLLDGANDYIDVGSAGLFNAFNGSTGTVLVWFKVSGVGVWTDGQVRRLVVLQADSGNRVVVNRSTANNMLAVSYIAGGTNKNVYVSVSSTGWVCVALTWNKTADEVKVYKNGEQQGSTLTGLGSWSGTINTALIGADTLTPTYVWSGCIAHGVLWDVALTEAEIAMLAEV